MQQLLTLCASIIEATTTPYLSVKPITQSVHVLSDGTQGAVMIDSNDAVLTVTIKLVKPVRVPSYTETIVNLKQYTGRPPVEVIEELTQLACEEWKECKSEYLIDNKIKNLLNK